MILRIAAMLISCAPATRSTTPVATSENRSRPASVTLSADEEEVLKGGRSDVAQNSRQNTDKRMKDWDVTSDKVRAVADLVAKAAVDNGIPEDLIYGVIWVESRFNPEAVSPVGARGLMQLMPKTADYLAECIGWQGRHDSFDPEFNIAAGSYYVARLIKQFGGDVELALAAYNAGPTNIRRWMNNTGLPPVSIEYHTMVLTARNYFRRDGAPGEGHSGGTAGIVSNAVAGMVVPSDDTLDRLGLAILISGFENTRFGLDRPDDASPFN